jgi:flagellum-specific ATP synthase
LDGHVILTRRLASQGHYPAIDVLESISRLFTDLAGPEHRAAAQSVRELLAAYRDHADLISIGAYRAGTNPTVDAAIAMRDEINQYLRQAVGDASSVETARQQLLALAQKCSAARGGNKAAMAVSTKSQASNHKQIPNPK